MEQSLHSTFTGLRLRQVIGGGGGGGRKLADTIPPAVGSKGVVGSSYAPSVCAIPPQATRYVGMSGVGSVVLSSRASAIGEITIVRFCCSLSALVYGVSLLLLKLQLLQGGKWT